MEPTIARDATYPRAPDELRARLEGTLAEAARERRKPFAAWALGTLAACATSAGIAWMVATSAGQGSPDERVASEIVNAHVRSLMAAGHLIDVESSDQHTVKPWFTGKLDFAPPVVDYASEGFTLTGGRLDYVEGRAAAAITYRHRQHVVNLFVWPAGGRDDQEPVTRSRQGYSRVGWTRGGMRYCVISDTSAADLSVLAKLVR
jgi:anti-sigma factor RsiW